MKNSQSSSIQVKTPALEAIILGPTQTLILGKVDRKLANSEALLNKCEKNLITARFYRLKGELSEKIHTFQMSEERKSYFLHQLAYVHSLKDLVSLVKVINKLQSTPDSRSPKTLELIYIQFASGIFSWDTYRFTVKKSDSGCNNVPH